MIVSSDIKLYVSQEVLRLQKDLDREIGDPRLSITRRRVLRKAVFDLIKIDENLLTSTLSGIKASIAQFNQENKKSDLMINPIEKIENQFIGNSLTKKEIEILNCLPLGLSISQLAKNLNLTESTIKSHLSSIYRKLSVKNRVQAIASAKAKNLLTS